MRKGGRKGGGGDERKGEYGSLFTELISEAQKIFKDRQN